MANDLVTDAEILNHTGPGTPLGNLLRRYWIPALPADELADEWSPPVRVTLLNERLVAFKDTTGRIALLQEFCAHRRASLYFGRNESEQSPDGAPGLRCPYHGWKYDVTGQCIDMPNEPPTSRFKDHIKIDSYPAVERGGIIWTYMGPIDLMPGLPELEWAVVPESHRYISRRMQKTCFTQAMEGGIDSSHVGFLHDDGNYVGGNLWSGGGPLNMDSQQYSLAMADLAPRFYIEPTDYGLMIGAQRTPSEDEFYWRITQWLMPWYTLIASFEGEPISGHAWVPIDDEHCWTWSMTYHPDRPLTKKELDLYRSGHNIHTKLIPGTELPTQNDENDYLISRVMQKHMLSVTGMDGAGIQDQAVQEGMGPQFDPDREHLGSADAAIVGSRRRLLAEARTLAADEATTPSNLDPHLHRVRAIAMILKQEASWIDATAEQRSATTRYYAEN